MAVVLCATPSAAAHPVGASESEIRAESPEVVSFRAHFGVEEAALLLPGVPLGADESTANPRDRAQREAEATAFFARDVEAAVDERPCEAGVGRLHATLDGVDLETTFRCGPGPEPITVTYFFLSKLGPEHRHMAVFRDGDRTRQALLTPARRSIMGTERPAPPRRFPGSAAAAGLLGLGTAALFSAVTWALREKSQRRRAEARK